MALPFPFSAGQTDAESPIDQDLMNENFQQNIEYLDTQIGAGGGGGLPPADRQAARPRHHVGANGGGAGRGGARGAFRPRHPWPGGVDRAGGR